MQGQAAWEDEGQTVFIASAPVPVVVTLPAPVVTPPAPRPRPRPRCYPRCGHARTLDPRGCGHSPSYSLTNQDR
jgi:hypothetical protein